MTARTDVPLWLWTLQLRYVRCGKDCGTCRTGPGHGPYWYGFRQANGRMYSHYFGKRPTSHFDYVAPEEYRAEFDPRFVHHGKMTLAIALRILGLDRIPDSARLRDIYYALIKTHHPDLGGSTAVAAAIIAAYQYLRR